MKKSIVVFLFFFLWAVPVLAKDVFIARISSDYDKSKTYDLILDINDRKLIAGFKTRNNKKKKVKIYSLEVMKGPIVLVKTAGIKLVTLQCNNFNTVKGCDIVIRYPYNITYARFREFHCKISRRNGKWGMFVGKKRFTSMHLVSKKALGVLVGIQRIDVE